MLHELAPHIVVISGPAGCCKTALCLRVAEAARARGLLVRGIVSPPRLVGEVKTGIDVLDLHSGERRPLAESGVETNGPATTKWRFDAEALAWGTEVLHRSVPCDLLVIDELGPLELLHGAGWAGAVDLLRTGGYRWALVVVRPRLVERFLEMVPPRHTTVVSVTQDSQDELLDIMARLWGDDLRPN